MTLFFALACASAPPPPAAPPAPVAAAPVPAPPAPAPAPAAGDAWPLDSSTSTVTASVHKLLGGHDLTFPGATGSVHVQGGVLTGVDVVVPIGTLTTDAEKLRLHLLTPDFFDAATLPNAEFHSTSVAGAGPDYTVTGDLNIHGHVKSVSFPATASITGSALTASAEVPLNRRDFVLEYPGKPDNLIQDAVELHVKLVAAAK